MNIFNTTSRELKARSIYEKRYARWYPDAIFRAKIICQLLGKEKPLKHILDAGGFFPTAYIFSDYYSDSEVAIYNLYENDTPAEFSDSIKHQQGDVTDINFPENYFDMVFLGETIEHVYDIAKCFKEIKRVLKPNGYVAITTPNLAAWFNRLLLLFGKCPHNYHPAPITYSQSDRKNLKAEYGEDLRNVPLYHYHIRVFTLDRLRDYLKLMGFTIIKSTVVNFTTEDRKYRHLRKILNYILPKNAKEGIIVIAKNIK